MYGYELIRETETAYWFVGPLGETISVPKHPLDVQASESNTEED